MSQGTGPSTGAGKTPESNQGMGMPGGDLAAIASSREVDPTSIKITADLVKEHRIVFLNSPEEIKGYMDALMSDKKVRLATAGYSASPSGYEGPTTEFLSDLIEALGDDVALVTSPTCDKGSIDAITSTVGQRAKAPLGYITADSYLCYIKPENFPADIDRGEFAQQLKFAFPDAEEYSRATAVLSNSFLVTGGRNASINDFMNAIRHGNKVIVLLNGDVPTPAWDTTKNRVDNAAEYLFKIAKGIGEGNTDGIPMDHEFNQKVSQFMKEYKEVISTHVKFVNANSAGAIQEAVGHLTD
jgi:hypothetical protein